MAFRTWQLGALAIAVAAVGCSGESQPPLTPPQITLTTKEYNPNVPAGWKLNATDPMLVASLKDRKSGNHGQSFAARNDPFALLPEERAYDLSQGSERLLADTGSWSFDYEGPKEEAPPPVIEEQPYRRLAGVIVGESVLALIDMGDGRPLEIIRPGQRIPNSDWTVVSIDEEKAILRRPGNKLPHQIVVRLESPPAGFGSSGTSGAGGPGGPAGLGGPNGRGGRGAPSLGAPGKGGEDGDGE